jgi:TonB family protein
VHVRCSVAIALSLILTWRTTEAQVDSSRRASSLGTPVDVLALERPALPREDNPTPKYPDSLRARALSGVVRAGFIVTADGRIDLKSVEILESPDSLFSRAVLKVLPALRFYPAEIEGPSKGCLTQANGSLVCKKSGARKKFPSHVEMPFRFDAPTK